MQDFLNSILDFITSEKVAYVLSLIAALYIPVSKIVSSIANKKLEKKILNKDAFKGCNYTKWLLNSKTKL